MKYVLLFCKSAQDDERFDQMSDAERSDLFRRVASWQAENSASFVHQGFRLDRGNTATTVRRRNGSYLVTDGPFVEGGEIVGGYSVVDVPDLQGAVAIARGFPACPTVEIRPVLE
jgi:hypothetical protein